MNKIHGLIRYLESLKREYGLTVIIKDFIGFLDKEETLYTYFQHYYVHQSAYCMYVKEDSQLWHRCLRTKERLQERLEKDPVSFYGICHAGVGEYAVPIIWERDTEGQKVIGAVTVGGFKEESDRIINQEKYDDAVIANHYSLSFIEEKIEVVTEYIRMLYASEIEDVLKSETDGGQQSYVIGHAIAYIRRHYSESLTLKMLSDFCHCSTSYMSHQFKKTTGRTLKAFVNEVRIEQAKTLLKDTDMSITDIANAIGYKDSNYFSRVFSESVGVTARNFRYGEVTG